MLGIIYPDPMKMAQKHMFTFPHAPTSYNLIRARARTMESPTSPRIAAARLRTKKDAILERLSRLDSYLGSVVGEISSDGYNND